MTQREQEILQLIEKDPMISQQEIADALGITRSSVAVHISNLIRKGYIAYIINTSEISDSGHTEKDGTQIRRLATENNANLFTSLDTVSTLLDVLEETTLCISTIDA